jgi:hypothetical protein
MNPIHPPDSGRVLESPDGSGAGDHDQPYRFEWRPRAEVPFPFSTRQYARLLVLRSRIRENAEGQDWPPLAA